MEHLEVHYVLRISMMYRIRLIATPGFYFSKWVFGWGSIWKIPEKVDFLTKKWGFNQENPQKQDFSHYLGLYSRVGLQSSEYGKYLVNKTQLPFWGFTKHITFDIVHQKGLTDFFTISRFECTRYLNILLPISCNSPRNFHVARFLNHHKIKV